MAAAADREGDCDGARGRPSMALHAAMRSSLYIDTEACHNTRLSFTRHAAGSYHAVHWMP